MKNQQIISENSHPTSGEALLTLQLNEALRLIRQLQRNNAELMRQNTGLMKINSGLIAGKSKNILPNGNSLERIEEDSFVNDILSLINDQSSNVIDKSRADYDSKRGINDHSFSINDKNTENKDNKPDRNENKTAVNDNKTDQIEINGKMFDRQRLLERLRFAYNVKRKQNLTDEQILTAQKNFHAEIANINEKMKLEKMHKVPALFFLEHEPERFGNAYEETFDKVLRAYRNLKKRNKKNTPSLVRQVKMLLFIYQRTSLAPQEIFAACKLTGITGFRYAAKLRNYGLIDCYGRGTACYYCITQAGKTLLENASV